MIRKRIFPFDKVEKGSKVILYGAGKLGRNFWNQNEELQWCEIIVVLDRDYAQIVDFPVKVHSPEALYRLDGYDYIVITIAAKEIRKKAKEALLSMEVPENKIIDGIDCFFQRMTAADYPDREIMVYGEDGEDDVLRIGFYPMGAIGDYIISLKMYQELVRLAPKSEIDVFVDYDSFPSSIFYGQTNLRALIKGYPDCNKIAEYDLVLELRFEPHIRRCKPQKLKRLAPSLAESMEKLYQYEQSDYVDLPIYQYANRILLDRSKFMGWNRYTLFGSSGAFDIRDQYVQLYTDECYEERYRELFNSDRMYITYNFGANDQFKDGKRQTKMWPYEYHVKLNEMLKASFPQVELIQLGAATAEWIPGADRYIMGEHFDVVKYILKNSLFHFDCEGGLVHMATQLGTKCFVVFGPTPVWFMGYDRNINIVPKTCGECKGLIKDWYTRCYKYDRPECMYSITPEYVFSLIEEYMHSKGY